MFGCSLTATDLPKIFRQLNEAWFEPNEDLVISFLDLAAQDTQVLQPSSRCQAQINDKEIRAQNCANFTGEFILVYFISRMSGCAE